MQACHRIQTVRVLAENERFQKIVWGNSARQAGKRFSTAKQANHAKSKKEMIGRDKAQRTAKAEADLYCELPDGNRDGSMLVSAAGWGLEGRMVLSSLAGLEWNGLANFHKWLGYFQLSLRT